MWNIRIYLALILLYYVTFIFLNLQLFYYNYCNMYINNNQKYIVEMDSNNNEKQNHKIKMKRVL